MKRKIEIFDTHETILDNNIIALHNMLCSYITIWCELDYNTIALHIMICCYITIWCELDSRALIISDNNFETIYATTFVYGKRGDAHIVISL
jgi:hypothetical protein